jgi:pimeloyl-ACP methyl ester carboxylesterase
MQESIFNHPVITERYFFPMRVSFQNPFWVNSGGTRLACFYARKFPEAKTILMFHGNGEVVADYIQLYLPVVEALGFNCFLAEYRGYGMSEGEPGLATILEDVEPIIHSLDVPPQDLILFGRSLGSLYVLHAVSLFPQIGGLIIESGIADILERVLLRADPSELGISEKELERAVNRTFNHQRKISGYPGPTLIMHAKYDSLVNNRHGLKLHAWSTGKKELKIFSRGDHNSIFHDNQQEYLQTLRDFLAKI